MTEENLNIVRQLTVVGHGECGKTSLLNRHLYKNYSKVHQSTVFSSTKAEYKYGRRIVELKLWDTAGQDEFTRLRDLALPNAHYILICFNVDSRKAFGEVSSLFVPHIKEINPTAKFFLAATKIDLRDDSEVLETLAGMGESPVTKKEGMKLASEIDAIAYFECSAKTDVGIDDIFQQISKYAYKEVERQERTCFMNFLAWFKCC